MRETIEFRIAEERAQRFLDPGLGTLVNETLRKVVLPTDDRRVREIGAIERKLREQGGLFFTYWNIERRYSATELKSAELLNLVIRTSFEPTGSMCGTGYDESVACEHCGAGARQTTALILDTRRIAKSKDMAQTLAGEVVVSSRFVEAFQTAGLRGAEFRPVMHGGGKALQSSDWYQPVVTSKPLRLAAKTLAGNNPFDLDERDEHRCPKGHIAGLNQLSELYVERASHDDSDVFITDKLFGDRRGELRPEPRWLISPRLRDVLSAMNAKGHALEVAHFV
ncbi:hypothetical protein HUA74_27925 [Myxococcus sp. CA051A]|uniref:hypothetical protein n=1 Tax=Myxococcus sp. CA051A TaxID=2741739 RepID=UPI00157BA4B3|nr:hypothetical protein [Myxococcus sp. CA051A]NTX64492.1 hypothetical protein [Myxococcus sp. CA051A]